MESDGPLSWCALENIYKHLGINVREYLGISPLAVPGLRASVRGLSSSSFCYGSKLERALLCRSPGEPDGPLPWCALENKYSGVFGDGSTGVARATQVRKDHLAPHTRGFFLSVPCSGIRLSATLVRPENKLLFGDQAGRPWGQT